MHTNLLLVSKPGKSSQFRLWVTAIFFITLCSSVSTVWAQTRLGLHVTQEELDIWRQRANDTTHISGTTNYRVNGDVQANSPGDWTRILANANAFKLNTTVSGKPARDFDRFLPWAGTGCYPENSDGTTAEGRAQAGLLKDAAFVYLVKQDATYLTAVKAEILAYVRNTLLNFSNRSRWCRMGDTGFKVSEILNRILFAYDYVRIGGGFTSPEQTEIQAWAYQAALWLSDGVDEYYRQRFVNRLAGDYTLTSYSIVGDRDSPHHTLFFGGPLAGWFTDGYNNRILTESRFVAMVAMLNNDSNLKIHSKRVFQDYLKYSVFPGGEMADMTRWEPEDVVHNVGPETGLKYSLGVVQGLCDMADVFARDGDYSLYNYSTEVGAFGTASPGNPKSLIQVIQNIQKYFNGGHVRYASSSATTLSQFLINGVEPVFVYHNELAYDTWFSIANKYYKNATIRDNYLRKASLKNLSYPAEDYLYYHGPNHPWGGQAAIYPGVLFMSGQLESNQANPFRLKIASSANNVTYTYGTTIPLTVDFSNVYSLSGVEYYKDGEATPFLTSSTAPYNVNWIGALVGVHTVKVRPMSTPDNPMPYSNVITITVNKATPVVTWPTPAPITYGTALSITQLNATASVSGTFVYNPGIGAVLSAGVKTLTVNFTPADTITYKKTSATVQILVNKATPVVTWPIPAPITYGTALSATQLNATASVGGTLAYTPSAGTVLSAGNQTLSVTLTPTDQVNYTTATQSVPITVNKAISVVTWNNPASITYGTPLSSTQLNATASGSGSFAYTPSAGAVLGVGANQTLSVTFTPSTTNYTTETKPVQITVVPAPSPALYLPVNGATSVAVNVNLQCYTIANATSYTFEANTNAGFTPATAITKTTTASWILYNGLQYNTTYYVRVKTNLSAVWGVTSSFTTQINPGGRTTGEALTQSISPRMRVFPNPSTGKVFVDFTTTVTEYASVNMYDMWGGLVQPLFAGTAEAGEENRLEMDGSRFAAGMYVIRLVTPTKVDFQKVIFQK